jgi:hypothetical protein
MRYEDVNWIELDRDRSRLRICDDGDETSESYNKSWISFSWLRKTLYYYNLR